MFNKSIRIIYRALSGCVNLNWLRLRQSAPPHSPCYSAMVSLVRNALLRFSFVSQSLNSHYLSVRGIVFLLFFFYQVQCCSTEYKKFIKNSPKWMKIQLNKDFRPYQRKRISLKKINKLYKEKVHDWLLVKFVIEDREVFFSTKIPTNHCLYHRVNVYYNVISNLAKDFKLPDMTFLISLADGFESPEFLEAIPIFAMCKSVECDRGILIPDFDALNQGYQVINNKDITRFRVPWENKVETMIWRGSTAQGMMITNSNFHQMSRVKLCELSFEQPQLIDAKFTIFAQFGEPVPYLEQLRGEIVSFEDQLNYKYHILIDGNASAYSASGWKFFTNSLVFKPDSRWIQWYYSQLIPFVHYVPVNASLSDLLEKIQWAIQNDSQAKAIAQNSRDFACTNITFPKSLTYLCLALLKYSKLKFE